MAYYVLEPWGTEPDDLRTGVIASTMANLKRDSKRVPHAYKPEDFMPKWDHQEALVEPKKGAELIRSFFRGLKDRQNAR